MTGVRATKEVEFVGNCRVEAGAFSDRFYPALRRPVPLFFFRRSPLTPTPTPMFANFSRVLSREHTHTRARGRAGAPSLM